MITKRSRPRYPCALALLVLARSAAAQDVSPIPAFVPINPVTQARSSLQAGSFVPAGAGWRWNTSLEYASIIEYNLDFSGIYLLDAEVGRLRLELGRDLSPRYFAVGELGVTNAQAGFMDGFFNWYHDLFGLHMEERKARPRDSFAYQVRLPDGRLVKRERGMNLGDLRLSLGRRHNAEFQTALTLTLPSGTGGDGYARGVPSLGTVTTMFKPLSHRAGYQGSVGLGFTPSRGDLAAYQRTLFGSASSGVMFRIWGRQSLFLQLFYHTPYYHDTGYRALDRHELEVHYGWLLRAAGRTWRIGMTEDLIPGGPAVDAIFELGVAGSN